MSKVYTTYSDDTGYFKFNELAAGEFGMIAKSDLYKDVTTNGLQIYGHESEDIYF